MPTEIRLPKLGQTMEEAAVVAFSVKAGDKVAAGDVIFEIETDKATMEVDSPAGGFVRHIFIEPGQSIAVGLPVMLLTDTGDEPLDANIVDSLQAEIDAHVERSLEGQLEADVPLLPSMGEETAVRPEKINLGDTIPMTRLQKITAQRMLRSKREIPSFYLNVKADVTEIVEMRSKLNGSGATKISYNDFLIKAVAIACEKFPEMTGRLKGDCIEIPEKINIALAVALSDGLVTPVVKDVASKSLEQVSLECKALIEKARENKLLLTDLEGACTTVSNLGDFGADSFTPIVIPGQATILGVGRITDTYLPDYDTVNVRKLMSLTLSVDHKVANGAKAAQFLDLIKKTLEDASNFQ